MSYAVGSQGGMGVTVVEAVIAAKEFRQLFPQLDQVYDV